MSERLPSLMAVVPALALALLACCGDGRNATAAPPQGAEKSVEGKTLAQWAAEAKSGTVRTKHSAISELTSFGPAAAPILIELLDDKDRSVAHAAAERLANLGPSAKSALPRILKLLQSKAQAEQAIGLAAISGLAVEGRYVIPAYNRMMENIEDAQRARLLAAIPKWEPGEREAAIAAVKALLKEPSWEIRCGAATVLAYLAPEEYDTAVATLVRLCSEGRPLYRFHVGMYLVHLGSDAGTPALAELLAQEEIQFEVYQLLSSTTERNKSATPVLQRLLRSENLDTRFYAALLLAKSGPPTASEAVPTLIEMLSQGGKSKSPLWGESAKDRWIAHRQSAAMALAEVGPEAKAAVAPLTVLLAEEHPRVRFAAAWALRFLGPAAQSALPSLNKLLEDETPENRLVAALAIRKLDPKTEPPALVEVLLEHGGGEWDWPYRIDLRLEYATDRQVKPLLRNKDRDVRYTSVVCLGILAGRGESPCKRLDQSLIEATRDDDAMVRVAATWALGRLGKTSPSVTAALTKLVEDANPHIRKAAQGAIKAIRDAEESRKHPVSWDAFLKDTKPR